MKKRRAAVVLLLLAVPGLSAAGGSAFAESYGDTGRAAVKVSPDEQIGKISPYIYGINEGGSLYGVPATVIKQRGSGLSSYNWETNYSCTFSDGVVSFGVPLIEDHDEPEWDVPALYTDDLMRDALVYNIPVKLATLQLMGYVAGDAMGVAADPDTSDRWAKTSFRKNDSYLNIPDTDDGVVYIDEYAAYLVNKYGTVEEGGFNGFFLDTEPDLWKENYPIPELEETDGDEITERSAQLASSLKIIDQSALVFGPSVSGISGLASFGDDFAAHYLSKLRQQGEKEGTRLLDVFDIHYKAHEGTKVNGEEMNEEAFRMQSVRALYDSSYSDDTAVYAAYGEYMPMIPYLKGKIEENYPGTKLSLSEYSFGGGSDISGCIAETDALGIFGRNGVYLACLVPDEVWEYQKAALSLYRNYDKKGSKVGNISVPASVNDTTSSCYAMTDEELTDKLWIILTNKNLSSDKTFEINISSKRDYTLSEMYVIEGNSSRISKVTGELPEFAGNKGKAVLSASSVCLLVMETQDDPEVTGTAPDETDISESPDSSVPSDVTSDAADKTIEIVTEAPGTAVTEHTETADISEKTGSSIEIITAARPTVSSEKTQTEITADTSETIIEKQETKPEPQDERTFPLPLKAMTILAAVGCAAAIVYVLILDK